LLSLLSGTEVRVAATAALALGLLSFAVSPLHLGRPALAPLAMRNWRTSWLSREVLALTSFGAATSVYATALWLAPPLSAWLGAAAVSFGVCGVYASARIYLVPGRPAWNSGHTIAEFFLTAATLGPLLLSAIGVRPDLLPIVAAAAAIAQIVNQVWKFLRLIRSEDFEEQASARLLSSDLARLFLLRLALLAFGGAALPLTGYAVLGFAAAFAGEILGRYLFFVSVVPKNMAMTFFGQQREAA
jgi:DMSO reductase anchor subunit